MLYAEKGYIAKWLAEVLDDMGIKLVTTVTEEHETSFPLPLREGRPAAVSLIETVFDELKNPCQIEHNRHCLNFNFAVNLMAGIITYCLTEDKPTLSLIRVNAMVKA